MAKITFDYKKALGFIGEDEISFLENQINNAHEMLHGMTVAMNILDGSSYPIIMIKMSLPGF